MNKKDQTLEEFIIENHKHFEYSTTELVKLLNSICLAAKAVSAELSQAGLADILGDVGNINIQGESQQKLDVYANELFISMLSGCEIVCGIVSEENDNFMTVKGQNNEYKNKYVVLIDPLDGSSNIDVNVSVGTVFSIYRRITKVGTPVEMKDFLQLGNQQVMAGYIVYGTSTILVYTAGYGVNGFTLNRAIGTYFLSHPKMTLPDHGSVYSINEGNYSQFPQGVKDYIKYCQSEESDRPYTARYIGSLVSDIHRNILKGGVYIYPQSSRYKNGKLRLLYECNPIAFIVEQAGGKATDGHQRILDIQPKSLHQCVPFFCGNKNMIEKAEEFIRKVIV